MRFLPNAGGRVGPLLSSRSLVPAAAAFVAALVLLEAPCKADIQDPPLMEQGPIRKLGRGIANIAFGVTEIPIEMILVNENEGNSTVFSYGAVRSVGRFLSRLGFGVYEVATFPFPNAIPFTTYGGTYYPPYRSNIPWVNGGLEEFPPELGFETRYNYVRTYSTVP